MVKWGRRNVVSRRFHANNNKETIATWRLSLDKILRVFDVRPFARVKTVANFLVTEGTPSERDCNSPYRSQRDCGHQFGHFQYPE